MAALMDEIYAWCKVNASDERKDGQTKKFEGLFSKFEISRAEAEAMVVQARLSAGWITQDDLAAEADAEGIEGEAEAELET